jgi:hypothetical protein
VSKLDKTESLDAVLFNNTTSESFGRLSQPRQPRARPPRYHMSEPMRQPASPIDQPKITTMTENKAPAEPQGGGHSNADQPGRPYYEQLRTTLRGTLDKKRKLDDQLAALEDQIFKLEGAYLEETSNSGNIVRGFDGWVKGVSVGGRGADDRRRGRVRDEDRVFSHSSVGWMKVSLP